MAKVKEHYLGNMTQYEIETYLYNKNLRDVEYEEWYNGEGYVTFVNEELEDTKLIYSTSDIRKAIQYGISSMMLPAYEIGDELYGKMLEEKVFEYLNSNKE
jgi:hypothetical protein